MVLTPRAARAAAFCARTAFGLGSGAPVGTIMPQAPSSAPSRSSRPSRRSRSNGAGQRQLAGLGGREAEAGVIGRVAEQDHRAMAARLRRRERVVHQRGADAELAAGTVNRQRAEHERRDAPGADVPQPHGAHQPALAPRPTRQGLRRARVRRAGAGRCAYGGFRQSRHPAALRARRRPKPAPHGSRTERHSEVRATGVFRKAVMARQSSLPRRVAPRSVVRKFASDGEGAGAPAPD